MLIDTRYEVIERLGTGAWSSVFKVRDLRSRNIYALKLYQKLDSQTIYEKFSAEDMFIITKIEHPNLLKVFNFGNYNAHIYSLTEYYDGNTLSDFKFTIGNVDDLYSIIVQVCYGLHELHRRGIIHKDLKPENIMYRIEEGKLKVKILDFGFTKIDLEKSQQHISGTLPYIAPEIFRGKKSSPESDFYSLGVTLYKVVTGTLPYSLEQLSDIITGTKTGIFPKFPTELNFNIPPKLEKLILKLMEKVGEDRFPDCSSIISYINRIQTNQYYFSWKYSLINSIEHSSFLIREDYTHQLLSYIPLVQKQNGKVIILTGEEGSGKDSILTLFRYHLLSDEYYLFDFTCTPTNKHPFFALIREFLSYICNNQQITKGLTNISEGMREYLGTTEPEVQPEEKKNLKKSAKKDEDRLLHPATPTISCPNAAAMFDDSLREGSDELKLDYSFAKNFLENLSAEKPLIFIIRVGHFLSPETIGFINFTSPTIKTNRILIVLTLDNPGVLSGLIHTVHIPIAPLSFDQIKIYVKHLLNVVPPDDYCYWLSIRSNGNPSYIRQILVDLISKKQLLKQSPPKLPDIHRDVNTKELNIYEDSTTNTKERLNRADEITPVSEDYLNQYQDFNFHLNWDDYKLPKKILHNIFGKISRLTKWSYEALQQLSIAYTPLSPDLIKYLLNVDDKRLFFLIQDSINTHTLIRREDFYYFSYPEARERLFNETEEETKISVSIKILEYFEDKKVTQISICQGLIKNARLAADNTRIRKYSLLLSQLYVAAGDRESSFQLICDVIALDFSKTINVPKKDILLDLALFQETAELTGRIKTALSIFDSIPNIPDIYEKFYIRGVLNNASENYKLGMKELEKALNKVITGKQRINALINIVWSNINLKDNNKAQKYLSLLDNLQMSVDVKVAYIDRKAVFLYNTGRVKEAIQLMEDFKNELQPFESATYYAKTGSFYNNLALFYSSLKYYDEATQYFTMAKNIWEQINYKRSLGMSYNNLGDLALRQGHTGEALSFFNKALSICKPIENLKCEVLTYLNFGETYIKLGKYEKAETYLIKAKAKQAESKDKAFLNSIIQNLAIAKNKIKNFHNFYQFIKEYAPNLLTDTITTINPIVKTYIQYLLDIGAEDKVLVQITNNTKLDYISQQEEEFYHQVTAMVYLSQNKYNDCLYHLHLALNYAERNRSTYAECIIRCKLSECYIALGNIERAKEMKETAEKLSNKYNYSYWKLEVILLNVKINLIDESINLREVLRELLSLYDRVSHNKLYLIELECCFYLYLTYHQLKSKKHETHYYNHYLSKVKEVVRAMPKDVKKNFIERKTAILESSIQSEGKPLTTESMNAANIISPRIAKRSTRSFEPWQEQLYELLKLNETERLKFFISKMLIKMFAPNFFSLVLSEEHRQKQRAFINYQFSEKMQQKSEQYFQECLRLNDVQVVVLDNCNTLFIPLRFKNIVVGALIIGDAGELPFTRRELNFAKELRLHLTSLLIRIKDITVVEKNTSQMKMLMMSSNEIFSLKDVEKIEQEMVSFSVDFTGCSRAFLIKKDTFGNFVYQIAMDSYKNIINEYSHLSKTVLSEVYNREQSIYTLNAMADSTLKNSISVQDYSLHSIYCAPLMIEKEVHGLLYLDNLHSKEIDLQINVDLMDIFLLQMSIALKNAKQYESLMKKNLELHSLDTAKTEFMAIISHELNTPLMLLQNYINRLKNERSLSLKDRESVFNTVESSLSRIMDKVNDIFSFTKYNLLAAVQKDKVDIKSLLEIIIKEAEIISRSRKMFFYLEVKENFPPLEANWESLYLMIYQIILNAIRFTKDFGSIHIGARKSSFQDEEIEGKESLVVYIQDNGMGIPAKDMDKIFVPFKELNDLYAHQSGTIEYKSGGLGLGLATANRIAELHNGKITVKSKEGEGTTVFIILPFAAKIKTEQLELAAKFPD